MCDARAVTIECWACEGTGKVDGRNARRQCRTCKGKKVLDLIEQDGFVMTEAQHLERTFRNLKALHERHEMLTGFFYNTEWVPRNWNISPLLSNHKKPILEDSQL